MAPAVPAARAGTPAAGQGVVREQEEEQNSLFGFPHEYLTPSEAQKIIARINTVSPQLVEYFSKMMH